MVATAWGVRPHGIHSPKAGDHAVLSTFSFLLTHSVSSDPELVQPTVKVCLSTSNSPV